ncbi:hypothetical protein C8R44DRAFT_864392 [Mycena epipterygia]|nr:hypothetical protein C8R44DRAFT_864392 [Mycena epipterygia]
MPPRRSPRNKSSSSANTASSAPAAKPRVAKKTAGSSRTRAKGAKGKTAAQTTDEWYKSPRTKKGYGNYVKGGKTWLEEWTSEGRLDDEIAVDAFDNITDQTPLALRALTAYKCEHLGRGFASAEGLRSAFKDYFERVCGCQGEFWKYNAHTEEWEGNPVFETGFKSYYESLKNRHNRTGTATQALPMLPADLKMILEYLDSDEAIEYFTFTQRLYFKAFVTTAFTLWTRNDELINLQFKDVKLHLRSKTGIPYHEFALIFRKTNKDPTKVQKYMVQIDTAHPEIDCYTHVGTWKTHMEKILGRPLAGNNFVFPAIASTGQLKFGECTSRSAFEILLDEVVEKSNVMQGRNGKFTTYCFRRGGAQYRFLWADRKWSLKAVKWWGGWSSNENVGTLMRYLLDELIAYEEGFSDIMMDDRAIDRHETFMGEDETAPVSKADLLKFEETIFAKLKGLIAGAAASSDSISLPLTQSNALNNEANTNIIHNAPVNRPPTPETPSEAPRPSRIPETKTLDDALLYWEHGSPQKGLLVPLKDWTTHFKPSEYATEAVKFGNIRFVCEEFRVRCVGDHGAFEAKFPGLQDRFTMLMKAVRAERKMRGDTNSRTSSK